MVIKHCSFEHKGGWYHYRVHQKKCGLLNVNGYKDLNLFLDNTFKTCPHDLFFYGPRSSLLRFDLKNLDLRQIIGHEVSSLAGAGLKLNNNRFKTAHSKVQVFMLENDANTIAIEVPIWLFPNELEGYSQIFNTKDALTGHIDILRVEGDRIWVWDYKPNAHREKYASTQVYFYALMLSKRTNINLSRFRCGYFDRNHSYIFNPDSCEIGKNKRVLKFFRKGL